MLAEHDYRRLAGMEVPRTDRIARYAYDDLGGPGAAGSSAFGCEQEKILVTVPIAVPRVGSEEFFGEVVVLVLRRDGQRFRIAGFGDDPL